MVRDSPPSRSRRSEYPDRDARKARDYPDNSRRGSEYGERSDRERDRRRRDERDYEGTDSRGDRRGYDDSRDRRRGDKDRDREREHDRRDRGSERRSDRDQDRERQRERERGQGRGGSSRRSASPHRPQSAGQPQPERHGSRSQSAVAGAEAEAEAEADVEDKAKPNFNPSGLLAAATKTIKHDDGTKTVLKYHEPPEARKPTVGWRLYVFKGKEQVDLLHIHRQSAYLVGRDKTVADIALDHPSCSKQHAAIQFRQVHEKNEYGDSKTAVKPFIIDLESTNGTIVNDETIPTSRYYELKLGDVVKFGESAREYVLLSEDAA